MKKTRKLVIDFLSFFRMKKIHKLVLKAYLGPLVVTFFIITFILMMNFVWRYIDELVGKGLEPSVIAELLMYATMNMIPMGLPLAILLATIMTMGNLGENHELLAMKSAGMSLRKIMMPLFMVIGIISVGSFFLINDLVPHANRKMYSMLFDIKQQRPSLEFQDGLFFNGINGIGIRVDKQDPDTKLLKGVLIYDNRSANNDVTTTIADSGYIRMSPDNRYLLVTLMKGESFERTHSNANNRSQTKDISRLRRSRFARQEVRILMDDVSAQQLDKRALESNPITMDMRDLERHIDTLDKQVNKLAISTYNPMLRERIFVRDPDGIAPVDSIKVDRSHKIYQADFIDSLSNLDTRTKFRIYNKAYSDAGNIGTLQSKNQENEANKALVELYRSNNEWHRKLTLPVSIFIFFLIGAPLGAIIRKGGLGMPIVISLIFFVVYYIISISGEKYAREGEWTSLLGMWIPIIILTPLALVLMFKANNDSPLFNLDWYREGVKRIRKKISRKRKRLKKHRTKPTTNNS